MSESTAEVMQSYLVKLGYKTDFVSLKKFEDGLSTTGKKVFAFGGKVAAVVASVEAATIAFAYSMRKQFFAADLAGSSVKSLNAISLAGKQAGVDADTLKVAVTTMTQSIRDSGGAMGGTAGLLKSFGVTMAEGGDNTLYMLDAIEKFNEMGPQVGSMYAKTYLGIDSNDYFLITKNLKKLRQDYVDTMKVQSDLGVNTEAQKKVLLQQAETYDKLRLKFGLLVDSMLVRAADPFSEIAKAMDDGMSRWIKQLQGTKTILELMKEQSTEGYSTAFKYIKEKLGIKEQPAETVNKREHSGKVGEAGKPTGTADTPAISMEGFDKRPKPTDQTNGPTTLVSPAQPADPAVRAKQETSLQSLSEKKYSKAELKTLANQYEAKHGLEENLLYGIMGAESNFNNPKFLKSGKGAEGPMGIMPATQKEFGVKNPYDVEESLDKMGLKMKGLKRWAGGDVNKALGAYNAGEGNYLKRGNSVDGQVKETRDYIGRVNDIRLGASQGNVVTQTNNVNISVSGIGAEDTAKAVGKAQTRVLGDATRMLSGSIQ